MLLILIIAVTVFFTWKGLKDSFFQDKYSFSVEHILIFKEYIRMVSSGVLHTGWMHLVFNMLALYMFGGSMESYLGPLVFGALYILSLLGSNGTALLIHKNDSSYSAVGASGAVNGVIYASIALFPFQGIGLFIIPVSIPAWIFGALYVGFSIYGIKTRKGNSGHSAHLGGALTGMLMAILLYPEVLPTNYLPILLILVPTMAFLLLIVYKPHYLLLDRSAKKKFASVDHRYNHQKITEQMDMDSILEKIHKKGMNSLTKREKEALERYSRINR